MFFCGALCYSQKAFAISAKAFVYFIFVSKRSICLLNNLSINSENSTKIIIAKPANTKKQYSIGKVIDARENKSFKRKIANTNAPSIAQNKAQRIQLNGKDTLNKTNRPANPVIITASVEISVLLNWINEQRIANAIMLNTIVIAPGMDLRMTFTIYFPFTRSLFGSNAKIKEGAPIVNALIKVR